MRFPRVNVTVLALLVVAVLGGAVALTAVPVGAASTADHAPAERASHGVTDVGVGASTSLVGTEPVTTTTTAATEPNASASLEPAEPAQLIHVNVTDDGDAVWTIESRFALEDEDDEAAFESFAESVIAGERDAGYDPEIYETFLEEAETATDREMAVADAGYDDYRIEEPMDEDESEPGFETETDDGDHTVGIIAYSFTWEAFGTTDDNRIYVGDAFQSADGGTWFPELGDGQRLVMEIPSNYGFDSVPAGGWVEVDDRALIWHGPYQFDDGAFDAEDHERELTLLRGANGDDTGTPPPNGVDDPDRSWLPIAGAVLAVLIALGLVGTYVLARSNPAWLPGPLRERVDSSDDQRRDGPPTAATGGPRDDVGQQAVGVGGPPVGGLEDDEIDPELLSDEERVLRLLRKNGGRMKQATIVKETGWSNAKVSQLLSKMDDDAEIDKLRIGRENLITLPEVDPTEVD